jgi:hypothetical protein
VSENSEFEAEKLPAGDPEPLVAGDRAAEDEGTLGPEGGQYVGGDYGEAGVAGQDLTAEGEGAYPEGDYGAGGVLEEEGAGVAEGEYAAGDYGKAGTAGSNLVTADDAEYPDGDYGRAGSTGTAGSAPDIEGE